MAKEKKLERFWRQVAETTEYAQMTPEEQRERTRENIKAALKSVEAPEQKRQREEAKWRRHLEKLGTTPEEFDEGVREFRRKFYPDQE